MGAPAPDDSAGTTETPNAARTAAAGGAELMELGTLMPLRQYLREVWKRRYFAKSLAENDLRSEHLNSALGQLWHLLNPAMMISVYFFIFGVVLDARRGVENYITFLIVGVMIFRFSQDTIIGCGQSVNKNIGLMRSIQFPRSLVPIAILLEQLMALMPAIGLIVIVGAIDGVEPSWHIIFLPFIILTAAIFNLGAGFALARAVGSLPDLNQVLPHFFRIMLYISGVLFSVHTQIKNQFVRDLFALNPFYDIVAATRWSILGTPAGQRVLYALVGWTVVAIVGGFTYFRRDEHRFGARL